MLDTLFFHLLILIIVANAGPILIKNILNKKWNQPINGSLKFVDGGPLFGKSKTWRGLAASLIITAVVALMLGYSVQIGILISLLAMTGDLFSSFVKRRFKLPPSSMAPLLDQVPESLLPAVIMMRTFELTLFSIIMLILFFMIFELIVSQILYKMNFRKHPY